MNTPPTVSVLMPVYNTERYLAPAVESVLDQDFADFEFLIVDDGSTDGSLAILRKFEATDPRIRLVSRPNTGYLVALNQMIDLARGEFLARMDSDDLCLPERFGRQVDFLRAHPEVVAVGSRIRLIDPDGCPLMDMCTTGDHDRIDLAHLRVEGGFINHPAAMIRANAMREVGGYRADFYPGEDVDLWLRLAEIGRLTNLPEVLLEYRQHLASIGYARQRIQHAKWAEAATDACRRRGLTPPPPVAQAQPAPSAADHLRTWGWWALASGHVGTARRHAIGALRRAPVSRENWRLALCALRGH